METVMKPFIHELISGLKDESDFKSSKSYGYIIRLSVFCIAYLEAYPFRADLDIFGVLGLEGIPEFYGLILAAFIVTFGSKQVHDLMTFFKDISKSRLIPPDIDKTTGAF